MLIPELAEQKGKKEEASGRFIVALQDLEPNTEVQSVPYQNNNSIEDDISKVPIVFKYRVTQKRRPQTLEM